MRTRLHAAAALITLTLPTLLPGQVADPCAGVPRCHNSGTFAATLTDFRESTVSYYRIVSVTLRLKNNLTRPLVLGYVAGSGLVTDDQGNRYEPTAGSLRGLGEIRGNTFDAKFTLQPGESADARLELSFRPDNAILGTRYTLELALREIDPLPGNQWRLGREHSLQYRGLGEAVVTAAEALPAAAAAPATAVAAVAEAVIDPCADRPRCYATGPFSAQVTSFADSKASYYHFLTYSVRFTNHAAQPLVLAYASGSAVGQDDQGNRYALSAGFPKGIGTSQPNRADASFVLRPGESRVAQFQLVFRPGRAILGTKYTVDFSVDELEVLPRNQLRTKREFTVGFRDLTLGGGDVESAVKGLLNAIRGRKP